MKFEFKCLQNKENRKKRKEEKEKRKKPITPSRPASTGPDYLLPLAHQPRWPAGGPSRLSGLRGRKARQVWRKARQL
jgi:hypothetical protein